MDWRRTTWILITAATFGCASTQYQNQQNPSAGRAELENDLAECRQNSMRPSAWRGGEYNLAVMVVDEDMVAQCLAARGWRPVSQ